MTEITETAPRRGVALWIQIVIWVALIGLLVMVGITLRKRQQGNVQPGDVIPNFTMLLYDDYQYQGKSEISLSELKGKVVVINFWASWCKPCEQEAAELEAAWKFYEPTGNVVFIGADYVDTPNEAFIYLQKYGITYPNGPADSHPKFKLSQLFRISGVPETYFIDKKGVLRYSQIGPFLSLGEIQSKIDVLLAE
jgi:cytochrome c biogenesis protein CcmG/thiol:disulfide interchange protein DsbE